MDDEIEQTKNDIALLSAFQITDDLKLKQANEWLLGLSAKKKRIEKYYAPQIEKTRDAYRYAIKMRDEMLDRIKEIQTHLKECILAYTEAQEKKRKQLVAEYSTISIKNEEDRILAEAAYLESAGLHEEAQAILSASVKPSVPVIAEMKLEGGTHIRETWTFEIVDENQIPRKFLMPNADMITKTVRAQGATTDIPGIRVFPKKTLVAGRSA